MGAGKEARAIELIIPYLGDVDGHEWKGVATKSRRARFLVQLRATGVTCSNTIAHASSAQARTMLMRRTDLLRSTDAAASSQRIEATRVCDGPAVVSSRRKLAFLFAKGASKVSAPFSISVRPNQRFPEESIICPSPWKKSASWPEAPFFNASRKEVRVVKAPIAIRGLTVPGAEPFASCSGIALGFAPLLMSSLAASES